MRKSSDAREGKNILTNSLIELTECVFKNNIFEYNTSFYKELRGTAIGTTMAPPYAVIFFVYLFTYFPHHSDIHKMF